MATRNLLICSGLDPSGGAGFLLDSRIAVEAGARPVGVITAHTVQTSEGVLAVHPADPELLDAQLGALLGDAEISAVKLGMLGSQQVVEVLGAALERVAGPVVWDPVLAPSRGRIALYTGSVAAAFAALRPSLGLLTPNAMEAALLTGLPVTTAAEVREAALRLRELCDCAVLLKGGHLGGDLSVDTLLPRDSDDLLEFAGPRLPGGEHVHGTGCALSSAVAARLACGDSLPEACRAGKALVARHLAAPVRVGRGALAMG
ncbi:MAG TPA: hydroxymethylpyrimidine/phosphomethylpyrimidine kinase [Kofleriaceae bacterium]|nr:hydroxymethylpyrimidine/phosphomethylpyrimidine kinase [Kofleriaceae bacterium]